MALRSPTPLICTWFIASPSVKSTRFQATVLPHLVERGAGQGFVKPHAAHGLSSLKGCRSAAPKRKKQHRRALFASFSIDFHCLST